MLGLLHVVSLILLLVLLLGGVVLLLVRLTCRCSRLRFVGRRMLVDCERKVLVGVGGREERRGSTWLHYVIVETLGCFCLLFLLLVFGTRVGRLRRLEEECQWVKSLRKGKDGLPVAIPQTVASAGAINLFIVV